jgi:hypothetical protein
MIVAIRIAKRFGEPLPALAEDSARIGGQHLEQPVSTDAPWREKSPNWPPPSIHAPAPAQSRQALSCKPTSSWK